MYHVKYRPLAILLKMGVRERVFYIRTFTVFSEVHVRNEPMFSVSDKTCDSAVTQKNTPGCHQTGNSQPDEFERKAKNILSVPFKIGNRISTDILTSSLRSKNN